MQRSKQTISPLLYFILLSILTSLAFFLVGVIILALFSVKVSGLGFAIIIFLLLWKAALVGFVSWISNKKANNKDFYVKFIGTYLARFFGIIIGGILGYEIFSILNQSNFIGFLVVGLPFYFIGRWIGSKVSIQIGKQIDKVLSIQEIQITKEFPNIKSANHLVFIGFLLYAVIFPFSVIVVGLLINYFNVPIGYLPEFLAFSRVAVLVLSLISICTPWLLKKRWLKKYQQTSPSPESVVYWMGLTYSIVPAIYGFIIFLAFGASIFELCLYEIASSIAAIIWNMRRKESQKPNVG